MHETEPESVRARVLFDCGHVSVQPATLMQSAGSLVGALTSCPTCRRLVHIRAVEVVRERTR